MDESLRIAGDFELWARFFEHAELYGVSTPLGGFRVHTLQKTQHLNSVGREESDRLRVRLHGRPVSDFEIMSRIRRYVLRHALCNRLYRLGLLRY